MNKSDARDALPALLLALNHYVAFSPGHDHSAVEINDATKEITLIIPYDSVDWVRSDDFLLLTDRIHDIEPDLIRLAIPVTVDIRHRCGLKGREELRVTVPDGAAQCLCIAGLLVSFGPNETWGSAMPELDLEMNADPKLRRLLTKAKSTLAKYLARIVHEPSYFSSN